MKPFSGTNYAPLGYVDRENILIANKVIGHVANNQITDSNNNVIGYIDGQFIRNERDSVVAEFDNGNIFDNHHKCIGHYEGGQHIGQAGAAYLALFYRPLAS